MEIPIEDTLYADDVSPSISVELENDTIRNGEPLVFKIDAKDNLGIKEIDVQLIGSVNRKFIVSKQHGVDSLFLNGDTVLAPGVYSIVFEVSDFSGKRDSVERKITLLPTDYFVRQKVEQDPIGGSEGSWNYRFVVNDTLPFIYIHTDGLTDKMDIDLYLKRDGKVIAKSTSPTANETIYLHPLVPGDYTVTVQGWYVPHGKGLFNIKILK